MPNKQKQIGAIQNILEKLKTWNQRANAKGQAKNEERKKKGYQQYDEAREWHGL